MSRFKRKTTTRFKRKNQDPIVIPFPKTQKTRKRRRHKKPENLPARFHSIPNEIAVPSPFEVCSDRQELGYRKEPIVIEYGTFEMMISGRRLTVRDFDIFIALSELAVEHDNINFKTSLAELCGRLGTSYNRSVKENIKKSLRRLNEAMVETIGTGKGEQWIMHHIISWTAGSNNELIISLDPFFNKLFGKELMTSIIPRFRLRLKGKVTKQLYIFYQRQVSSRKKQHIHKYPGIGPGIGLEKLCNLIGVDRDNKRSTSEKRFLIKKGHRELEKSGYLVKWNMENDKISATIKTQKLKKIPTEPQTKKIESNEIESNETKQGELLIRQLKFRVKTQITDMDTARKNALKIHAIGKRMVVSNDLFREFVEWLKEQKEEKDWLKIINQGTLNPINKPFKEFMDNMEYEMPSEKKINAFFKRETESKTEKEQRQKQADIDKAKREKEKEECKKNIQWATDYIKKVLKDLKQTDKLNIEGTIDIIIRIHGNGWQSIFKKYIETIEQEYQKNRHDRRRSYFYLFGRGSSIGQSIWQEIVGKNE